MTIYTPEEKAVATKVKQLLETKGWCQGAGARDKKGRIVHIEHPYAAAFCLSGAIALAEVDNKEKTKLWSKLNYVKFPYGIKRFNDDPDRKKAEIIAILDEVIES